MSKSLILNNHEILERDIEEIIKYGLNIIKTIKPSNKREVQFIIEGLLLRACAIWEKFIETEVIYLVDLDKSKILDEFDLPVHTNLNKKLIKTILFSDLYRDFHDIDKSKSFFKTYIADHNNLFKLLNNDQINKIKMIYKSRNYLAHYSEFARKKLLKEYNKSYGYMKFMEPGIFLIKSKGKHFENLLHNFVLISATMKKGVKIT
jgi:hypothetical protein